MQGTEHDIALFLALGCAIALHCIALYCSVLYCIALHCILKKDGMLALFGTVPPIFPPKTVEKQSGMLAFFCISSASKLIVFSSILVSFSFPRAPLEPPGPLFFTDGAPDRFFCDF